MSHVVICPECHHEFRTDREFEKYEKLAAQMVDGDLSRKNQTGYDVIDRLGIKYQVKYSKLVDRPGRKRGRWGWVFDFKISGEWPDYFILYGINKEDIFCFLLSFRKFIEKSSRTNATVSGSGTSHRTTGFQCHLKVSNSLSSWIWDYRVTPDTFMEKLKLLISVGEFTMSLEDMPREVYV